MSEPFFKKYTDLIVGESDLVGRVFAQGNQFSQWLNTISEAESTVLHPPYTWTLKEVLNHLSDCERVFAFRALWIAREGSMPMMTFDENEFARLAAANRMSLQQLRDEFASVRACTHSLLLSFVESDWQRVGQAGSYSISLEQQVTILIGHVEHHWNILRHRFSTPAQA